MLSCVRMAKCPGDAICEALGQCRHAEALDQLETNGHANGDRPTDEMQLWARGRDADEELKRLAHKVADGEALALVHPDRHPDYYKGLEDLPPPLPASAREDFVQPSEQETQPLIISGRGWDSTLGEDRLRSGRRPPFADLDVPHGRKSYTLGTLEETMPEYCKYCGANMTVEAYHEEPYCSEQCRVAHAAEIADGGE